MRATRQWWMAGLIFLALAGCTRQSVPLAIPKLEDVETVYISKMQGSRVLWRYDLKDPARIAPILEHLRTHNPDEYRIETDLYSHWVNPRLPEYEYDIGFLSPLHVLLSVAIGPDWLGGEDDLERFPNQRRINLYRCRPLGAEERAALVALLQMRPGDRNILEQK